MFDAWNIVSSNFFYCYTFRFDSFRKTLIFEGNAKGKFLFFDINKEILSGFCNIGDAFNLEMHDYLLCTSSLYSIESLNEHSWSTPVTLHVLTRIFSCSNRPHLQRIHNI